MHAPVNTVSLVRSTTIPDDLEIREACRLNSRQLALKKTEKTDPTEQTNVREKRCSRATRVSWVYAAHRVFSTDNKVDQRVDDQCLLDVWKDNRRGLCIRVELFVFPFSLEASARPILVQRAPSKIHKRVYTKVRDLKNWQLTALCELIAVYVSSAARHLSLFRGFSPHLTDTRLPGGRVLE